MAVKPYSFRFPYDIQTSWDAMRKMFTKTALGLDPEYATMLNRMTDRDRALEDYLSLGIGQGVLALAQKTDAQDVLTTDTVLTDLEVTFNVPANRTIKVSAKVGFEIVIGAAGDLSKVNMRLRPPPFGAGDILTADSTYELVFADLRRDQGVVNLLVFLTPTPGEHTYKLTAEQIFNVGTPTVRCDVSSTKPGVLMVEDIGPAN